VPTITSELGERALSTLLSIIRRSGQSSESRNPRPLLSRPLSAPQVLQSFLTMGARATSLGADPKGNEVANDEVMREDVDVRGSCNRLLRVVEELGLAG
jgi:hypothetical protein